MIENFFFRLYLIGMFDVSVVGNLLGKNYFVIRFVVFLKFMDIIVDDVLDLVKVLVVLLIYGMIVSLYY